MNSRMSLFLFLSLFAAVSFSTPLPQLSPPAEEVIVDAPASVAASDDSSELINLGGVRDGGDGGDGIGNILQGVFGFLHNAIKGVSVLAQDKRVQDGVAGALNIGMNATGELLKTGTNIVSAGPTAVSRSTNLIGGLIRTTQETSPTITDRLDELDRFGKLFSTFVRSYQGVLVDNIEDFGSTFNRRLRCHTECDTLEGEAKETCEALYCINFNAEEFSFDDPPPDKGPDYDVEYDF
jgi:hypothetical protein